MADRFEETIGHTHLGRPIQALFFARAGYAVERPTALLVAALQGDEPLGVACLVRLAEELVAEPPGRDVWIVPALNLDGLAGGSQNNARDVDLDRNFAARSWSPERRPGFFPGPTPQSEPETQALVRVLERSGARRLVALRSPHRTCLWNGGGEPLATAMGQRNGYGAGRGPAGPGSLAARYGDDLGLEVVSLEIPLIDEAQAWSENRAALRHCVDLG